MKSASGFDHSEMSLVQSGPVASEVKESIANAVVRDVPFDGHGTKREGEDGWEFDELELV